jgi:hypothetical protein
MVLPAFAMLPLPARRSILHAFGRYAPWESGFNPIPPAAHAGEMSGPPDFVGIGVQKAGTTWWYQLICAHPDVWSRPDIHKERHFFNRYAIRPFGTLECSLYRSWFPRPSGFQTGEWTPDYFHLPWVPGLLAQAAPESRLLVVLRDPVERFRSGVAHLRNERTIPMTEIYSDAVSRGFYGATLRRWMEHFPSEQILLLQYERCVIDPAGELARTYHFLGLDPFIPEEIEDRVNASTHIVELDATVRRRLVELYASDMLALSLRFPDLDLDLWPSFAASTRVR